jgi:AcrR family transcriptional regulator
MPRRVPKSVALPPGLEAAWGRRREPSRGPRPELSLQRIVGAGVALADSRGIDAVSMSRVAAALGAATMALYRHVRTKEELLLLMVDAALGEPPAGRRGNEGWRSALERWALGHLAALRRRPWMVRVPIGGPPIAPNQVVWFDRGLGCFSGTGLAEVEKLAALQLVDGVVRNQATLEADLRLAAEMPQSLVAQGIQAYGRSLAGLIDAERFPALSALLAAGVFEQADDSPDSEFVFGLERVLDGIETFVRTHGLRGRARRARRRS